MHDIAPKYHRKAQVRIQLTASTMFFNVQEYLSLDDQEKLTLFLKSEKE